MTIASLSIAALVSAAAPTACLVDYDEARGAIAVRYPGAQPLVHTAAGEAGLAIAIDFPAGASVAFRFGDDLPRRAPFVRWGLHRLPDGGRRLAITFERPLGVQLAEDEDAHVAYVIPVGRVPAPPPVRKLPALPPVPAPPAAGAPAPALRVGPALGLAQYQEHFMAGDVAVKADAVAMPGLMVEVGTGAWRGALRLQTASYAFRDDSFPLSVHVRRAAWGELAAVHHWDGPIAVALGAGYMARYEQAMHSAVAPASSYAFSNWRLLHAPMAVAEAGLPLLPWLRLQAEAGVAPYVFSHLDLAAPGLPALIGSRIAVGLEADVGPLRVQAMFQRWGLDSPGGYTEAFTGPAITIH